MDLDFDTSPTESATEECTRLAPIEAAEPRRATHRQPRLKAVREMPHSLEAANMPDDGLEFEASPPDAELYEPHPEPPRGRGRAKSPALGRELPHSLEAEELLLSCCLIDGTEVIGKALRAGIRQHSFYDPKHGIIYACLVELYHRNSKIIDIGVLAEELKTQGKIQQIGGYAFLSQVSSRAPTTAQAEYFIEKVREQETLRDIIRTATGAVEDCYSFSGGIEEFTNRIGSRITDAIASPAQDSKSRLRALLELKTFKGADAPTQPAPRLFINGVGFVTSGNISNVIAQAKAGKSALIAAFVSAVICADLGESEADTLGITAAAPAGLQLLCIDTEQSPFDFHQGVRRTMRRAGVDTKPEWLRAYGLAGFTPNQLRLALLCLIEDAHAAGGIFAVIIDGTADMVNDVNDSAECNAFVAELHALAIKFDCPIINVVHENPGQDGGKMRGHFGSQLERKGESNLRLKKTDEVTVVFSEKMRGAPIRERDGPRFRWDNAAGMHVSCASAGATKDDVKRERLRDQAESVFTVAATHAMPWSDFVDGVAKSEGISRSGAIKRFDSMKALGVVSKDGVGFWRLVPSTPEHPDHTPTTPLGR